ncbi:MAG: acyl-CoA dehydrogenase family protein [Bdellovibrionales bacterium]|nr:acyl-CoA dehydrogenase family protein [Bdellovibrionales bacterium]
MFELEGEEHAAIRDSLRRLARDCIPAYLAQENSEKFPRELFQKFSAAGLSGMSVDERHGGARLSPTLASAAIEEIAAVNLGPAIFLSVHSMVSGLIEKFANDTQKQLYLPKLARGEWLGAFALTEASAGSDAAGLKTVARKDGSDYILNGDKCWITSGGFADLYLVFAKTDPALGKEGISAFIVDKGDRGLSWGSPEKKMGCELSPISTLQFDDLRLPADRLVGQEGQGYRIALGGLAGGRISIASCAVGLAREALDLAVAHLTERKQFGQSLIEFQGLQFMLADMKIELEASRMLTWRAAHLLETNPSDPKNRLYPSIAKCKATDAAMKITTDAVQLFGGAGYVREYPVERLMRDAKMLQIVEGANQIQRGVIARQLREHS